MYVPPERIVSKLSYSAFAAACFSSSVMGLRRASSCSRERSLSNNIRSRSSISRSAGGRSAPFRPFFSLRGGDLFLRGEGDRDGGARFLAEDGPGEYDIPGGGVGSRTADDKMAVSAIL